MQFIQKIDINFTTTIAITHPLTPLPAWSAPIPDEKSTLSYFPTTTSPRSYLYLPFYPATKSFHHPHISQQSLNLISNSLAKACTYTMPADRRISARPSLSTARRRPHPRRRTPATATMTPRLHRLQVVVAAAVAVTLPPYRWAAAQSSVTTARQDWGWRTRRVPRLLLSRRRGWRIRVEVWQRRGWRRSQAARRRRCTESWPGVHLCRRIWVSYRSGGGVE